MIIVSYLRKNILRTFLVSFSILLAIFIAQQVIVAFNSVSRGSIPPSFIVKFIALNLPSLMQYFLPFALFLGILFTFIRMYNTREITAMFALGTPYRTVFSSFLPLTIVVFLVSIVNSFWVAPTLLQSSMTQVQRFKTNPDFSLIKTGSFTYLPGTSYIIFVNSTDKNKASDIFLFDYRPRQELQVVMAKEGVIQVKEGVRQIILNNGVLFSKSLNNPLARTLIPNLSQANLPEKPVLLNNNEGQREDSTNQARNSQENTSKANSQTVNSQDRNTQDGKSSNKGKTTSAEKVQASTKAQTTSKKEDKKFTLADLQQADYNQKIFDSSDYQWSDVEKLVSGEASEFYQANFARITINLDLVESTDTRYAFKYKTINEVLVSDHPYAKIEIMIRVVNSLAVFLLATMAFVFGKVNPRSSRSANVISSISLYFIYFLVMQSLSQVVNKGKDFGNILTIYIVVNILLVILIYLLASGSERLRASKIINYLRSFMGVQ